MKKYLFDEIEVNYDGSVEFITFRDLKFIELFITNKCGPADTKNNHYRDASERRWTFSPKNFKQFLNCLALTKTYDEEYIIDAEKANVEYGFENLLKLFAKYVYEEKNTTKKELVDFYNKAYEIKQATVAERALLEKDIEELIR